MTLLLSYLAVANTRCEIGDAMCIYEHAHHSKIFTKAITLVASMLDTALQTSLVCHGHSQPCDITTF